VKDVSAGWWLFLVRGLLALAIGVIALMDPGATLAALILLLGAYLIVDGAFAVVKALRVVRSNTSWWMLLIAGVVGIGAGMLVFTLPGLTALSLAFIVGFWAILSGVAELYVAISLWRSISAGWLYVIFGAISIAFGAYVLAVPALGLAYLTILIAIYGFVAGFALIGAALRMRTSARRISMPASN
jgi:uncharacterized membrane protein HdeD (DUF308 family)